MKTKKCMVKFLLLLAVFFNFPVNPVALAVPENLDEIFSRKSRMSSISWGPGLLEDKTNNYTWQPETLQYKDVTTNNEVWKITNTPQRLGGETQDISTTHWSADGNRVMFHSSRSNQAYPINGYVNYGGISYMALDGGSNHLPTDTTYWQVIPYDSAYPAWISTRYYDNPVNIWMLSNTDGSRLKPVAGAPSTTTDVDKYLIWSPILSDVLYQGSSSVYIAPVNALYKVAVSDSTITKSTHITLPTSVTRTNLKKAISGDGRKVMINDVNNGRYYAATVFPEASKGLDTPNGYSMQLNFDYYWGKTPTTWAGYHDSSLTGAQSGIDGVWNYIMPENADGPWWRARATGSGANGDPIHIQDHTPPYDWGGEIEPVNGKTLGGTGLDPWAPDGIVAGTQSIPYPSHAAFDRWAHYMAFTKSNSTPYGTSIADLRDHKYGIFGGEKAFTGVNWVQHHDWEAWSDWSTSSGVTGTNSTYYLDYRIATQNYTNINSQKELAWTHTRYNTGGGTNAPYESLARPTQSPDGTKVMFNSTFLNTTDNDIQLFWTVAYYPYPPEIKSAAKNGTNVRLTWDFNQGTASSPNLTNPRTYATRGWPHETNDRAPSPRETKEFRVWSSNDKSNWTPVGKTTYNNCKGTNECGMWTETSWNFDAAQSNSSTKYYALTSIEHSGLESHTLSNVWKVTLDGSGNITSQVQDQAYPANPGDKTNFYATSPGAPSGVVATHKKSPATANGQYTLEWNAPASRDLVRYYNIYAKDGAAPTGIQQEKIASVPASSDYDNNGGFSYIDWAGNTSGNTQYKITTVDYQGNESGVSTPGDTTAPSAPRGLNVL